MNVQTCGEKWQQRCGLREWTIRFVAVPHEYVDSEQRHTANCLAYPECLQARVNIAVGFADAPRPDIDIDTDLAHETAHVVTAELMDVAERIAEQLPADARPLADEWLRQAEERLVRRLEAALTQ